MVPHKFQIGNKVCLHLQQEHLTGPNMKLRPLWYGPYIITKVVGGNDFDLSIPTFLGLHPIFNVEMLLPYFPPMLDALEAFDQLHHTEINPKYV